MKAISKFTRREEPDLAAAALQKDRKATAEFVALHADAIYGYIRHRLSPRLDLADDLVQDVFLAAWEHLDHFDGRSSLRNWLLGIARHKVEDYYRARLRELAVMVETAEETPQTPSPDPSADEVLCRRQTQQMARRVLERLPEAYGLVLLWRYWEKRTVREIAGQTGRTEKAIERLVARAREEFKRRWRNAEET